MNSAWIRIIAAMVLSAFFGLSASGEIIRLKNGVELHGEVLEFDAERGVVVQRYDNGGVVELLWEHILEQDVEKLKVARGYGGMEAEPILIRAKRLLLASGDYVIGVQVESSRPGVLTLHRNGKNYDFLQSQVRDIESVEVEAQEVYTAQELYDQKVQESLPETALDHFKLAVFCESVAFYERALEHYTLAVEQDPDFKPDVVAQKIEQMQVKQSEADATALLNDIRNRLYKKQFAKAFTMCDTFEETYPDSRQMGELEKLRGRIAKKRHDHFKQKILTDYFSYMDRIAYKVAQNRELELEDALAYARDEMGADVINKLSEVYVMEVEEVTELWQNRRGGRSRTSTYGTGTFILGEEAKDIPETEAEEEGEEEAEQPATLDEKLKKKIEAIKKERAKQVGKKRSRLQLDDIGQTPDQWWRNSPTEDRQQFVICFFAEKSGEVKVQRVKFRSCHSCAGKGWFEYFSASEEEQRREPCPVCKTLGIVRIVTYK